ncbi:MAG: NYN domain-containing protein [Promethearchaeota archaeon]
MDLNDDRVNVEREINSSSSQESIEEEVIDDLEDDDDLFPIGDALLSKEYGNEQEDESEDKLAIRPPLLKKKRLLKQNNEIDSSSLHQKNKNTIKTTKKKKRQKNVQARATIASSNFKENPKINKTLKEPEIHVDKSMERPNSTPIPGKESLIPGKEFPAINSNQDGLKKELDTHVSKPKENRQEKIYELIASKIENEIQELRKRLIGEITFAINENLEKNYFYKLKNEFEEDIMNQLQQKIKNNLKPDLKYEVVKVLRNEWETDIKNELKKDIEFDIKNDLETFVNKDMKKLLMNQYKKDISHLINKHIEMKVSVEARNLFAKSPVHLVVVDFNNLWAIADKYTYTRQVDIEILMKKLRNALMEIDSNFYEEKLIGFIFYSKYHDSEINAIRSYEWKNGLDNILNQFKWEMISDRKMGEKKDPGNYRDIDISLAVKATELIMSDNKNILTFTIVSGDGDFTPVLNLAKKYKIKTIVIAFKKGLSQSLTGKADKVVFMND